ncbi:GTP cyclohydrolase II [Thermosporothrix hazakensis]|jgi:3,4-dihydroxy 2-butanone 4-phosphate synthase/GTP cyclohydrolase II|uniref:GTP cyclohydrolase-2 n=1 Tax=Thermosporothrix hazakensis TaxID=644383 RepID=A0A326U7N5_THEHA|nr:GTP cyclohydrolase II [Thermosporothrix hazakensis]PZW31098.1 GTP cyclohydrolase II [Thermosporothrix hazakensis]GCE50987.1 riboflavin biosynthesis protein RibBA [Thermosporothrix hazakensis]
MVREMGTEANQFSVLHAARMLQEGRPVLLYAGLCDDPPVLCQAGQFVTAETVTRLLLIAGGELRVLLRHARLDACRLTPRARAGEPASLVQEIRRLVFPSACTDDQEPLLTRVDAAGYEEAALDLLRIAGLEEVAVLYEVRSVVDDIALLELVMHLDCGITSIEAIRQYRKARRVSLITEIQLPTSYAPFRLQHYQEHETGLPYLVLLLGDLTGDPPPLVRLHSECKTGDVFGSLRCDCRAQLQAALKEIAQEGCGMIIYLPQEGRGIGLSGKLQAYRLQERGLNTIEANVQLGYPVDARDYTSAIEILRHLKLRSLRLLTNNPKKLQVVQESGFQVERVPLEIMPDSANRAYLQTKYQHMGHLLSLFAE